MRSSIKMPLVAAAAASLALFGGALSASAASVTPTLLEGNLPCTGGVLVEPVADGTYDGIIVDVHGSSFDFTATGGTVVSDVFVKGGPDTNWYHYDPAVTSDTNLVAPTNPKNNRPYGLSHICFSTDDKVVTPPK